jgi:hypothetical protein
MNATMKLTKYAARLLAELSVEEAKLRRWIETEPFEDVRSGLHEELSRIERERETIRRVTQDIDANRL